MDDKPPWLRMAGREWLTAPIGSLFWNRYNLNSYVKIISRHFERVVFEYKNKFECHEAQQINMNTITMALSSKCSVATKIPNGVNFICYEWIFIMNNLCSTISLTFIPSSITTSHSQYNNRSYFLFPKISFPKPTVYGCLFQAPACWFESAIFFHGFLATLSSPDF